ncbi:MAG: hypothetical protein WA658_00970, partial [Candidatus Acidiferrales bacterium]
MAIFAVAVIALGIALKSPASRAQGQTQVALQTAGDTQSVPTRSSVTAASATGIAPAVVASNVGIRTMLVAQPASESGAAAPSVSATSAELYLSSLDQPDRLFSFVVRTTPGVAPASLKSILASPVVGTGAIGSVGDGGAASSAELDLNLSDFTMRSDVATAPDGTL